MARRHRPPPLLRALGGLVLCLLAAACASPAPEPAEPFFGTASESGGGRPPLTIVQARQPPEPPRFAAVEAVPAPEDIEVVTVRQPPPVPTLPPLPPTPVPPSLPAPVVWEAGFDSDGYALWRVGSAQSLGGTPSSDGRRPAVLLSALDPQAGDVGDVVAIEVPAEIVADYAGHEIEVGLRIRLPEDAPNGDTAVGILVAVGDAHMSGWRRFQPGRSFATFRFRWTAPLSAPTLPNYIAIRAEPGPNGGEALVSLVTLGIVGEE